MAIQISKEWFIELEDGYEHRVEGGQVILWKTGVTIVAVTFLLPEGVEKLALLHQIHAKLPTDIIETMVSTRGEIVGLGYSQLQKENKDKTRLSLTTFTVSDTSCLQVAFYLDNPDDLLWAKSVWEGIHYLPLG